MQPGEIYLGYKGSEILLPPEGRTIKPEYIEQVRGGETASGRYVEDVLWIKKAWTIEYEIMQGEFLERMVELYESGQFLNLIIVNRDGSIEEYEVKMTLIPPVRWKVIGPWYWQGGAINLRQVMPSVTR